MRGVELLVANATEAWGSLHRNARVVSGCYDFRLVLKEVNQTVHVKVFRWRVLALCTTAVEEALKREDLRAVHVKSFTQFDEAFLVHWAHNLLILERLVNLYAHHFELAFLPLVSFLLSKLVPLSIEQ